MKLRYRILSAVGVLLLVAVSALAIAISYDADCDPAPPVTAGSETMQANVYRCYGPPDVIALETVAKPEPGDTGVLVRVRAAAVNPLDWHYLRGSPYVMRLMSGIGRPNDTRLGVDFAGVVEEVGSEVTRFRPGDAVFGGGWGAFAEFMVMDESDPVVKMPAGVTFEEAAAVPVAAITALQALRDKGGVQAGDRVLVNGASGGVGPFAVQIAKHFGADVTGVCSAKNAEMVRELGADRVLDYRQVSYIDLDDRYDVIVDNVGNFGLLDNRRVMHPDSTLVLVGGPGGDWIGPLVRPLSALFVNPFVDEEFAPFVSSFNVEDMQLLADMLASGAIRPVIDRRYTLAELPDAIRYSEEGHARAKIVVVVAE